MHTTSKRIELESPCCSGFYENLKSKFITMKLLPLQSSSASALHPFKIALSPPSPPSASKRERGSESELVMDSAKQQRAPPLSNRDLSFSPSSASSSARNTPYLPVAAPDAAADDKLPPAPAVGGGGRD